MNEKRLELVKKKFGKFIGYTIWGLIIIFSISTVKNINRVVSIRKQVEEERVRVEKMEAENKALQTQINEAQGTEFIEKQMRDKLGLTKEGEAMVVLPDEEIVKSFAPPLSTIENSLPDPNWMKWKKLFL